MSVRDESEGKYVRCSSGSSCSMRLRATKSLRSSAMRSRCPLHRRATSQALRRARRRTIARTTASRCAHSRLGTMAPPAPGASRARRDLPRSGCARLLPWLVSRATHRRGGTQRQRRMRRMAAVRNRGSRSPQFLGSLQLCARTCRAPAGGFRHRHRFRVLAPVAPRCSMLHKAPSPVCTMRWLGLTPLRAPRTTRRTSRARSAGRTGRGQPASQTARRRAATRGSLGLSLHMVVPAGAPTNW